MMETKLPDAAYLTEVARTAMRDIQPVPRDPAAVPEKRRQAAGKALDPWAPGIDEVVDLAGAAVFLGAPSADAVKRRQYRARADGTRDWPRPDVEFGRSKGWKLRTIVVHQAEGNRRGHHGSSLAPVPEGAAVYLAVSGPGSPFRGGGQHGAFVACPVPSGPDCGGDGEGAELPAAGRGGGCGAPAGGVAAGPDG